MVVESRFGSSVPAARIAICLAMLIALLGRPAIAAGGDSPAEVLALAQAAVKAGEWGQFAALIAPSQRSMAAFEVSMGVDMMSEFWEGEDAEKLRARYEEIVDRYGVADPPEQEQLAVTSDTSQEEIDAHMAKRAELWFGEIDQAAFIGELLEALTAMPEVIEQGPILAEGELTDLAIEGDAATGKLGERELRFVREDGRWYMSSSAAMPS